MAAPSPEAARYRACASRRACVRSRSRREASVRRLFLRLRATALALRGRPLYNRPVPPRLQQIEKCKNENPDDINEVPVQTSVFDLITRILSHEGSNRHNHENRYAAKNVEAVKSGNHEEAGGELRHAPGIRGQARSFLDQVCPLERLTAQE